MLLQGEAAKMALKTMGAGMAGSKSPPRKAKVGCPECQADLHYTEGGVVHLDPQRRRVKCPECDFRGFHYLETGIVDE